MTDSVRLSFKMKLQQRLCFVQKAILQRSRAEAAAGTQTLCQGADADEQSGQNMEEFLIQGNNPHLQNC